MFSIKNLLKKVSLISATAAMSFNFCSSFVNAVEPDTNSSGVTYQSGNPAVNVDIGVDKSTTTVKLDLDLVNNLKLEYNGKPQKLLKSVMPSVNDVAVYLRVVKITKDGSGNITGREPGSWVEVWNDGIILGMLDLINVKEPGTYNLEYYIDGKGNYSDVDANSQGNVGTGD